MRSIDRQRTAVVARDHRLMWPPITFERHELFPEFSGNSDRSRFPALSEYCCYSALLAPRHIPPTKGARFADAETKHIEHAKQCMAASVDLSVNKAAHLFLCEDALVKIVSCSLQTKGSSHVGREALQSGSVSKQRFECT
ncbi:hypothetical protein AA21952_0121 [Acetobacter oeni LMG 21952]|nr:hypothetical protein AA21952_0121 [Acetobacter oeni LMG 21952]